MTSTATAAPAATAARRAAAEDRDARLYEGLAPEAWTKTYAGGRGRAWAGAR